MEFQMRVNQCSEWHSQDETKPNQKRQKNESAQIQQTVQLKVDIEQSNYTINPVTWLAKFFSQLRWLAKPCSFLFLSKVELLVVSQMSHLGGNDWAIRGICPHLESASWHSLLITLRLRFWQKLGMYHDQRWGLEMMSALNYTASPSKSSEVCSCVWRMQTRIRAHFVLPFSRPRSFQDHRSGGAPNPESAKF